MTDQYVPALRQRFLEDMRIKGLQPKTQTITNLGRCCLFYGQIQTSRLH